jgi:Kae1-associated kinase Bud32
MKILMQAAEAIIYLDNDKIIKKRIQKKYRLSQINQSLITTRTKSESKILSKLHTIAPQLIKTDNKNTIEMQYINGKTLKNILETKIELCKQVGSNLAFMHNLNIIHGDLTTSNMIYNKKKLYFIDFGLSFFSNKIEDKSVDIHLFKQALESKHYRVSKKAFRFFLEGYKESSEYEKIITKLDEVEKRGRNKQKNY